MYFLFTSLFSRGSLLLNIHLITGLLLIVLSRLFLSQALMKKIRTWEFNNIVSYLKTLFQNAAEIHKVIEQEHEASDMTVEVHR